MDYYIVRAELAGLDFDHRVLKPWANNPAFYVTVFTEESDQPAREGPFACGRRRGLDVLVPAFGGTAAKMDAGIRAIPALLEQAKTNLTGNGRDLWIYGAKSLQQQGADLAQLAAKAAGAPGDLAADIEKASRATDGFAAWLDAAAPSKTGPSGIGIENYDWYLKHVQLVPYTWREEVALMERELARSHALLAMEEERNAKLPPQAPIASAEEYARRFGAAVSRVHGVPARSRDPRGPATSWSRLCALAIGSFQAGPREFFTEVDYRDPEVMRTHGYHWFDKALDGARRTPSPIRRGALLYNIFNTRTEGHATGWEELMMQAGMFDATARAPASSFTSSWPSARRGRWAS